MATLTIRNVPDPVRDALRVRAAKAGRSMEAEARALIVGSVGAAADIKPAPFSSRCSAGSTRQTV